MKRLITRVLTLGLVLSAVSSASWAVEAEQGTKFSQAKNGLLMSPGVIELVKAEGEIALDDERITCQRLERTGSHLRETFCLTLQEAELARRRNQQTMWRYLQGVKR